MKNLIQSIKKKISKNKKDENNKINKKKEFLIKDLESFLQFDQKIKQISSEKKYIIILNVYKFMEFNIEFGFNIGNLLIEEIKNRIEKFFYEQFEEEINVFSTNPAEFAFCVKDYQKDKEILFNLIKEIEDTPFNFNKKKFYIKIRISVASNKQDSLKEVVYGIKLLKNKHKTIVFSNEIEAEKDLIQNKFKIFQTIKESLLYNTIIPYLQPVVDKSNTVHHYEVLARINNNNNLLTPNVFLDIAKEFGIYYKISNKILEKSLALQKEKNIAMSINLYMEDLENPIFRKNILTYLEKIPECNKDTNLLFFELNISREIKKEGIVFNFLKKIKEKNIKIILDDFGKGFSNIEMVYALEDIIWGVKYSGALVKEIDKDPLKYEMLKHLNLSLKIKNITTIAKFVETKEIRDLLLKINVNYFQGFFCSAPKQA